MPSPKAITQKMSVAASTVDSEGRVIHHLRPVGSSDSALQIHSADYVTDDAHKVPEFSELDITVSAKPVPAAKGAQK